MPAQVSVLHYRNVTAGVFLRAIPTIGVFPANNFNNRLQSQRHERRQILANSALEWSRNCRRTSDYKEKKPKAFLPRINSTRFFISPCQPQSDFISETQNVFFDGRCPG